MNGTVEYEYKDITHKEPFPSVEIKDFKKALAHFKNEKKLFLKRMTKPLCKKTLNLY